MVSQQEKQAYYILIKQFFLFEQVEYLKVYK
jgi:hypothetical protein